MSHSPETVHLLIESGPDQGRDVRVPPGGARVGRSESNEIALRDPSLSRFHCRFYFSAAGALRLADLASTNETLVNDKPIQDVALRNGDRVTIGETSMKVVCETLAPEGSLPGGGARQGAVIDLGLKGERDAAPAPGASPRRRALLRWLWAAVFALLALLAAIGVRTRRPAPAPRADPAGLPGPRALELDYEKVQASASELFYYRLELRGGTLGVQIHNLSDGRSVNREKTVDPGRLDLLGRAIENAGFFQLSEEYAGRAQDFWEAMDLTVTLGRRARRVRVANRTEPESFREVRLLIEEFGRSEIGLTALALPPERLLELARDAWQTGQNFFHQREVRHDNLARAIRSFTEVDLYLETVEPKPPFYAEALARREEAVRMLDERYEDLMFRADRAIRLRSWEEANRHLRIILDMLPDRDDPRYRDTDRKLMEVQSRMGRR